MVARPDLKIKYTKSVPTNRQDATVLAHVVKKQNNNIWKYIYIYKADMKFKFLGRKITN